jgi:hypothetical protein
VLRLRSGEPRATWVCGVAVIGRRAACSAVTFAAATTVASSLFIEPGRLRRIFLDGMSRICRINRFACIAQGSSAANET